MGCQAGIPLPVVGGGSADSTGTGTDADVDGSATDDGDASDDQDNDPDILFDTVSDDGSESSDPASAEECPVEFVAAAYGADLANPFEGPSPLTVWCTVLTSDGSAPPEGTYTWLFDGVEDSGPMNTHAERSHVFSSYGVHTVGLLLTVAGSTVPLSCVRSDTGEAEVKVTVTDPQQQNSGGGSEPVLECESDANCNDGNPCTTDACVDGSCQHETLLCPGGTCNPFTGECEPGNDPPVADEQSLSTNEDVALSITLSGSDPTGEALQYVIASLPGSGSVKDNGNNHVITFGEVPYALLAAGNGVTYTPSANYVGSDGFTFKANDGKQDSAWAAVNVTVAAVNDAPSFNAPSDQFAALDADLTVTMASVSPGPLDEFTQTVTFSATSSNQAVIPNANLDFSGTQLTITPVAEGGPVTITVTATDNGGTANGGDSTGTDTFQVTVVDGPLMAGTISLVETVGARPNIGHVTLNFTGSGDWSGTDSTVTTDIYGAYSQLVPEGWTGTVSAADPDTVFLFPESKAYDDPVVTPQLAQDFTAWVPPIGIPVPSFGIKETHYMYAAETGATYDFGSGPVPYPDAGNGPYTHYIDNTHPSATDANNNYGTPAKPRMTIPTTLTAGSVVEIHGGPYLDALYFWSPASGTPEKPNFIRGPSVETRPTIKNFVEFYDGVSYIIAENLLVDRDYAGSAVNFGGGAHHVAFRNSEVIEALSNGIVGSAPNPVHDIVIYNCEYHTGEATWDDPDAGDIDAHGYSIGYAYHIHIVDSHFYHIAGDAVQVNGPPNSATHHIYIARNIGHHNRQASFWSKEANDVIFSQNIVHSDRVNNWPRGSCMGMQYGPGNVWFLFNEIYDCACGIKMEQGSFDGMKSYFIGNVIHDIWSSEEWPHDPNNFESNAGMTFRGGDNLYIIGNTIWDVEGGIFLPSWTPYYLTNNIIGNITFPGGHHIAYDLAPNNTLEVYNSLFYQPDGPISIKIGSTDYEDIVMFEAAGFGDDNVNGDPQFTNPQTDDFRLQPGSPAIDAGIVSDVYETFYDLYGIDISMDFDGVARPQGAACDIGAFEHSLP